MAAERVYGEGWKNNRVTAAALAVVERRWRAGELHSGAGRLTVKDSDVTGLELRLSRTGARSWAISLRVDGQQRRFTIPSSADLSLAEARDAGQDLRNAIRRGADPTAERREQRRTSARAKRLGSISPSLRKLLDEFEVAVAKPKGQKSWTVRRKHLESEYRNHLDDPAAELKAEDIRRVLDAAAKRGSPVSGWHGFRYIRRLMSWAARRGLVPTDPTESIGREEVLDTVRREGQRERVLKAAETRALWLALDGMPTSPYAAIYKIIVMTGQRPNEVATMQWADVDLDRCEWVQTDNKSNRRHVVPLSREVVAILRCWISSGKFVFST
jgi:integrase